MSLGLYSCNKKMEINILNVSKHKECIQSFLNHLFQTLSVMIIDEEMEVVRGAFEAGNTLIHGVPNLGDMGTILDHVARTYFEPPITRLVPYEYPEKAGVGVPHSIPRTTTLGQIK